MEEERENVKIFNNTIALALRKEKDDGERGREGKTIKLPRDLGLGVGKLGGAYGSAANQTLRGQLVSGQQQMFY